MRSNRFLQNRRPGFAVAAATVLIIILAGGLYLSIKPSGNLPTQSPTVNPTPIPIPFDYRLDISPSNATVMQGNNVQIKVTLTYLQGLPENVTLSLAGVPRVGNYTADYSFSPRQGSPSNESSFNSTLPNSQWYAVSYNWISPDGASSGTNHLVPFPYHLYAEVGVTNKKCDFGF